MKVFVSCPCRGLSGSEITADRRRIVTACGFPDAQIIAYTPEGNHTPLSCLAKGLPLMEQADIVAFSANWQTARGCRIEHQIATDYGLPMIHEVL
jgi:hypothetical protein